MQKQLTQQEQQEKEARLKFEFVENNKKIKQANRRTNTLQKASRKANRK